MGRLTGCCCCFDLRQGARAIGITQLVLGTFAFIGHIVAFAILSQQENSHMGFGSAVSALAANVLYLWMNGRLVDGVNKNRPDKLRAWLIYSGITNGLQSVAVAAACVLAFIWNSFELMPLVLAVACLVGVFWYWFVVVLHCYWEMRDVGDVVYMEQDEGEQHAV